jgi:PKHD-type hydroxylase
MLIIEKLLSTDEVAQIRQLLATAEWFDGSQTAGTLAKSVKQNLQLDDNSEIAVQLRHQILRKLSNNPAFISSALPNKIYPPKFNCYCNGGQYGTHIDSAVMPVPGTSVSVRGDLSATIFFADPHEYVGGELEIEMNGSSQQIKLSAGDMVLYESGQLHRVLPVTEGARFASFFWVESQIRDPNQRKILFELDKTIQSITPTLGISAPELIRLTGHYHNLLRLWAST